MPSEYCQCSRVDCRVHPVLSSAPKPGSEGDALRLLLPGQTVTGSRARGWTGSIPCYLARHGRDRRAMPSDHSSRGGMDPFPISSRRSSSRLRYAGAPCEGCPSGYRLAC
eukprot:505410-Rhodomonas_salina.1